MPLDSPYDPATDKMDPDIKAQWVAALRSGEYKQGEKALAILDGDDGPKYCCLGVLCELAEKAGVHLNTHPEYIPAFEAAAGTVQIKVYGGEYSVTPSAVKAWAGLTVSNPEVEVKLPGDDVTTVTSVASLNDGNFGPKYDFNQIADVIEEQL